MLATLRQLPLNVRHYLLITSNYWVFTLSDGALRLLVLLHFHQLGYSALSIASLFLLYEFFGVVTNLAGGYLAARVGLNRTMHWGMALQIIALGLLLVPSELLSIPYVMLAQALSGIAKDLNKMSAKSSIKLLVPHDAQGTLFRWVALLTGSKNALKGVGFFLGGALLSVAEFRGAILILGLSLLLTLMMSLCLLPDKLGQAKNKPKFKDLFSHSRAVNLLSAARLCLFCARDVWFVVALPVFLSTVLGWSFWSIGGFMAIWVIGYGVVQGLAPYLTKARKPNGRMAQIWAYALSSVPAIMAALLTLAAHDAIAWIVVLGLLLFGALFAINSSLHSYLIVSYANAQGVSLNIGFYYMANAAGRLIGTLLSGALYQMAGLEACLFFSSGLLLITAWISRYLPR